MIMVDDCMRYCLFYFSIIHRDPFSSFKKHCFSFIVLLYRSVYNTSLPVLIPFVI
jgi:hypothetical protein